MDPDMRPLKESDIPDIIEISKTTWNGHDHLPNIITEWLDNPLCHPYVLDNEGVVIGVGNVRVIDEGMTGWLEGLRIHEDVRQKGLAKKLTDHLFNVARQIRVQRIRLVTSGDNVAPQRLAQSIGLDPVYTWQVFWKDIRTAKWKFDKIPMKEIQAKELKSNIKEYPELFAMPDNPNPYSQSILRHWDVFETTDQNIIDIGEHASFHFGNAGTEAVLSIAGKEPSRYGPEWCFTLYATSKETFLSGLSKNLEVAQEQGINSLMCIHQPQFTQLYESIDWLKERNHEISLVLHERYLK
ncbi:MAG: GNAT family N-acetyltransferase [Candidatus Thorarchaeota archaeon]